MSAWLMSVPAHWSIVEPRRFFRERRTPSRSEDVHLTPSQHYGVMPQDEYMRVTGSKVVLNLSGADNMKHVEPGDLVAHLRSFQGGLELSRLQGKVSTAYTVIEPLPGAVVDFYRWVLKSSSWIDQLSSASQGLRDGQSVKFDDFAKIPLPLPPVEEQQRIADFLDERVARIDQIIAARQLQWEATQWLRWSEFDRFLQDSPKAPLRRAIARIADGPFGSAFSSNDYVDEGPAVVRLGDIGFGEFHSDGLARVPHSLYAKFPRSHIRAGDLLIASLGDSRNHAGRACVAPDSLGLAMAKGKTYVARANRHVASEEYLAAMLSSPSGAAALSVEAAGATRIMLNFDRLLGSQIPLPPRRLQDEAIARLGSAESRTRRLLEGLSSSVKMLQEYKQSLITAAVTGELDVTTASTKIPGE